MAIVVSGDFDWDEKKAASNIVDHEGVTFEEAAVALLDHDSVDFDDLADPTRMITLGLNPMTGILYVVSTEGTEQRTRIISARKAQAHEQRIYKEGHRHPR
jgi:hypothetical protein